jgi:hypothetical protein
MRQAPIASPSRADRYGLPSSLVLIDRNQDSRPPRGPSLLHLFIAGRSLLLALTIHAHLHPRSALPWPGTLHSRSTDCCQSCIRCRSDSRTTERRYCTFGLQQLAATLSSPRASSTGARHGWRRLLHAACSIHTRRGFARRSNPAQRQKGRI